MSAVAADCQRIVKEASAPVPPGDTIKAQINRACVALGYARGHWRVMEAWYGRAGCFSAEAYKDLKVRHDKWKRRTQIEAHEAAQRHKAQLSRLKFAMLETDPDRFGPDVAALDHAIDQLGGLDSPLDSEAA